MSEEKGKGKVETINLPPSSVGMLDFYLTAIRTEATASPIYKAAVNEISVWAKSHLDCLNIDYVLTTIRTEETGSLAYKSAVNEISEWAKMYDDLINKSHEENNK